MYLHTLLRLFKLCFARQTTTNEECMAMAFEQGGQVGLAKAFRAIVRYTRLL